MQFEGFTKESLDFLTQVKVNNSKEWFQEHKSDYETLLVEPFRRLVSELSGDILKIDPLFDTTPAINRTISRIYRDTRFSKDKSLYRDSMWFTFKRPKDTWREAPAFFFEIYPDGYRYGMGYYSSTKESMDIFREMIDNKPQIFDSIVQNFKNQSTFVIEGDRYKKILNPSKTEEINEWYNRKNLYLVHNDNKVDKLFNSDLVCELKSGFGLLQEIYKYLCSVEEKRILRSSGLNKQ
jgi:uncharacterized protein (TIGR02453 family)